MATFDHVLCPIDFSHTSARAIRRADDIASWYHAELTVQYVYEPLRVPVPGLSDVVETLAPETAAQLAAKARTFAIRAGCRAPGPTVVVDSGTPADEIVARIARDRPDLLVIGTHGDRGFDRLLLGSVTERVLRRVACPVLTVPPHADASATAPFTRIVCGIDFSDWSLKALEMAAVLAQPGEATVTAVHCIEWPWHEPPAPLFDQLPTAQAEALQAYRREVVARAADRLERTARDVVGDRGRLETVIAHGKAHVALRQVAADQQADLIVLGVHGRSTVDVALFGSTTNQVVRHALCAVLTVRG